MKKQKMIVYINIAFIFIVGLVSLLYFILFSIKHQGVNMVLIEMGLFIAIFFVMSLIKKHRISRAIADVIGGIILVILLMFIIYPIFAYFLFTRQVFIISLLLYFLSISILLIFTDYREPLKLPGN